MRRLFALIGLTYLSTLTVVFYLHDSVTVAVITVICVVVVVASLIQKKLFPKLMIGKTLICAAVTVMCAMLSIFLYENIYVEPIIDNYSDKEISFTGFICDQPTLTDKAVDYIIQTDTVNNEPAGIKIYLRSYRAEDAEAFDKIKGSAVVTEEEASNRKSERIFLSVDTSQPYTVKKTGEKQFSLYAFAVGARQWAQSVINRYMYGDSVYLARAILLGEKRGLPFEIKRDFTRTGTSHLVVVSGMHFSVTLCLFVFLLRKLYMRRLRFCLMVLLIFGYCALTGFYPSVMRSGIMLIIMFGGDCIRRTHDSLNSLGFAGLCLSLFNPYAVGDIGMLLSFAATIGIVLWEPPIFGFMRRVTRLDRLSKSVYTRWRKSSSLKNGRNRYSFRLTLAVFALRIPNLILSLLAVSVSAGAWTMPLSVIFFGRTALLAAPLSVIAEPLAALILWSSLLTVCLCFVPPLAYACAAVCGSCCRALIGIISVCADLPFAYVKTDEPYHYIWLAVIAVLVTAGYILRENRKLSKTYIRCSVAFSLAVLMMGYSVSALLADKNAYLSVFSSGNGVTVAVTKERNLSLLSCGGSYRSYSETVREIGRNSDIIDMLIIPKMNYSHSRYLYSIEEEFDVEKILVYDSGKYANDFDADKARFLDSSVEYRFGLNEEVTDCFLAEKSFTAQYLTSPAGSVLYLTTGADIQKLPESWREPDVLILEGSPKKLSLLRCGDLYFTGSESVWERGQHDFSEVSRHAYFIRNQNLKLPLSVSE